VPIIIGIEIITNTLVVDLLAQPHTKQVPAVTIMAIETVKNAPG
jgi:hypothetical protein